MGQQKEKIVTEQCEECGGRGKRTTYDSDSTTGITPASRSYHEIECNNCHGTGKLDVTYLKQDYPDAKWEYRSSRASKKGCFVTTTVCDILNKDDNCEELKILRKFRDEELMTDLTLKKLVFEYYDISPYLIDIINKKRNKNYFALYLLDEHIYKIIQCIQKKETKKAISLYKDMIEIIKKSDINFKKIV